MELLRQKNLYPIKTACDMRNTVLVEFRLNNQGYKVHLTRAEKAQLESLLLSEPAQRQAEILIFYQQEQAALFAARFAEVAAAQCRTSAPRSPSITCNSVTSIQPPTPSLQTSQAQSQQRLMMPSGALLPGAGHVGQPPRLQPPFASTPPLPLARPPNGAPTAGTAAAPHSQPVHILQTRLTSATPVGMCMLTRVNNPTAAVLISPQSANPAVRPTQAASVSSASAPSAASVIRPPALTVQQASRMTNLRSMLHADHRRAVVRPTVTAADTEDGDKEKKEKQLPTPEELLELLLPYHTFQDLDNTPQAMEKVDTILEKALNQLNKRKRQTESAVASIMYSEKWRRVDFDYADRLVVSKMALDLDRDIFTAEKAACESFLAALDREYPPVSSGLTEGVSPSAKPKSFRELLESAHFQPLTFDEAGNARPASIPPTDTVTEVEGATEKRNATEEEVTPVTGANEGENAPIAGTPYSDAHPPSPLPNGVPSFSVPEQTPSASSPSNPPSLSDHRSEASSSTKQPQQRQPQNGLRRGLASEDEEEEDEEAMQFLIQSRENPSAKYTDVAPDVRWPEWTPDDDVDNCQELDMTSIAEDTVEEEEEDVEESEALCRGLKGTWTPCSFSLPNGVTDPSTVRSRSCLTSGDQGAELQHSEDPDLDAAIRSIIG
ncbi:unnamed protein product [Schistocephalus solidus]|uniref:GLTSCR1 domain-containing protein n=1 Tax=Schistocephalus solidus TaxID=70667 RepID=A0A183T5N4_SCHSO|nr:unnamed protein product [Schistocephalus solidus]